MRVRTVLLSIIALAVVGGADPQAAGAQDRVRFVVDGDWRDWGGMCCFDEYADVVPDTNRAVDLRRYEFGGSGIFSLRGVDAARDTLFTFLFQFRAPPFQGEEETTVEIFFDMSHSDSYGVAQEPWRDFRPDYVVGVTGSNGALTKEFYWRYTGTGWDKKEGADIPEVDIAFATRYLEGAMYWQLLDVPDTDRSHYELKGDYNSDKAVRVSKGAFRDYVPNGDYALRNEVILPTAVESDTWGGIKGR